MIPHGDILRLGERHGGGSLGPSNAHSRHGRAFELETASSELEISSPWFAAAFSVRHRRFENRRVVGLNDSVGQQVFELRKEGFEICLRLDELDSKGHVLVGVDSAALRVHPMVRSEARLRARNRGPRDAVLEEQGQDLVAQEVAARTGIFIQVNRDFLRRAGSEHDSSFRVQSYL